MPQKQHLQILTTWPWSLLLKMCSSRCPVFITWLLLCLQFLGMCIPWLRNPQLKFICLCGCVFSRLYQRPKARKGIIVHSWKRLGRCRRCSHFCGVTHVPLLKQMHHNVLCLFFNLEWFSSWAELLNINGMSTMCQNTTKTSCNVESVLWMCEHGVFLNHEGLSEEKYSASYLNCCREDRGMTVCRLRAKPNLSISALQGRTTQLCQPSTVYTKCCSNLDRSWPLQL